ncbi:MAG: HEPN domain-containing protein [Euryarchaeota archaeon]|nr:HEPN domain-containing protein [Euryarchaeota archaeon]MDE2046586.1 HEPN domain-containing protein [Thermoplasmata archaeon]
MRPEALRWLEDAEADLGHARLSIANQDHRWACFASQQAVEKALKAILLENDLELVRIHDLVELAHRAHLPETLAAKCADLALAYVGTRYRDAPAYPYEARSQEDVRTAEAVVQWARSRAT